MKKSNKLDGYITFSIVVILVYTLIALIAAFADKAVPDSLTMAFFAAFAGEILQCCIIKVFKLKSGEGGNA